MERQRHGRFAWLGCVAALCVLVACGGSETPDDGGSIPIPESVHWGAVEGAERYVVRAWAGPRLLFEETRSDTVLVLDPSMRRVCAAFDSVELRVRVDGDRHGRVQRISLAPR